MSDTLRLEIPLLKNIQPLFADLIGGGIACSHNGNLTNGIELRNNLVKTVLYFNLLLIQKPSSS